MSSGKFNTAPLRWVRRAGIAACRVALWLLAAACGLVIATTPGAAQDSASRSDGAAYRLQVTGIDSAAYPNIAITYTVPQAVLDAGIDPTVVAVTVGDQLVESTAASAAGPADVGFVVDRSASMFGLPLAAAADAARTCLAVLPSRSSAFLISYADRPTVDHEQSTDLASVSRRLDELVAGGETATHDALMAAGGQFALDTPNAADSDGADRFVIVLSDGIDTASQATLDQAIAAIAGVGGGVFSVAIDTGDTDVATLAAISTRTGGVLIESAPADLVSHCAAIGKQIGNRYLVNVAAPIQGSGGPMPISLSVGGSGGLPGASANVMAETDGAGGHDVNGSGDLGDLFGSTGGGAGLSSSDSPAPDLLASADAALPIGSTNTASGEVALPDELPVPPTGSAVAAAAEPPTSTRALIVGAGAVFAGLATMLTLTLVPSQTSVTAKRLKVKTFSTVETGTKDFGQLGRIGSQVSGLVEAIMNRGGIGSSLNASLDAAGINLRPSEYVAAFAGAGIGGFLVLLLAGFGPVAFVAFAAAAVLGRAYLKFRIKRRLNAFQAQLVETLMVMAGSVRAGHGLMQSIASVAEQADEPTSSEFGRVITEVRIGRDPIDSLRAMADRVGSIDLTWTVRAMALNRELGGNLAEILDNVSDTIRERNKIADQVRALSAEGKFSAYVLFGLPFGVVAAVRVLNPEYIEPLFATTKGHVVIGVSLTLMTIGAIWIRKMIQIEY